MITSLIIYMLPCVLADGETHTLLIDAAAVVL
jgi:hypothetical protein